ncbi:MAG TPA: M48 family metalloprotease [Candidatus Sulfotelmatobacter sp.]|nr:M48 family metalloprotease [Candidatus Sulfotelmatobacter sp.]
MQRLFCALVLALACVAAAPVAAQARTRLDARVDALTPRMLLTRTAPGLVDPDRQRRARSIADLRHLAAAGWGLAQVLAFWWYWRSGTAARVRDMVRRRTRNRVVHRAVFGASLGFISALAALPFAFSSYRISFAVGVTHQLASQWLLGYLGRFVVDAFFGALIVVVVLGLVGRTHLWYLIVTGLLLVGAVGGAMVAPLLPFGAPHKTTPHALSAQAAREAARLGVPGTPVIMVATARRSGSMRIAATGIGPTGEVSVADAALDHLTPPEVAAALDHADADIQRGDNLRQTLAAAILFIVSCALAVLLSDRVGFRRDDDVLSRLALVATLLGVVMIVIYPIYTAYHRSLQTAADERALAAGADRVATARLFVREADDALEPLCGRRTVRWYFEDTAPLGARIARAAGTADPCPGTSI